MNVGSLVYATDQGLGILARAFHQHGVVTHPVVVRHAHHPTHDEWYPGAPQVHIRRLGEGRRVINRTIEQVDVMLFFETPFDWVLIDHCRRAGVKTVLMPMYECMQLHLPTYPDLFLCPSLIDQQWAEAALKEPNAPRNLRPPVHLPVPVNVKWRRRGRATTFVHNAGHGGLKNRNGTGLLLDAIKLVTNPEARFLIRTQKRLEWAAGGDDRVEIRQGTFDYDSLYDEGQVFVLCDRFNGLSLPLQEARAAGMYVIATDRYPHNCWLPWSGLVRPSRYERTRAAASTGEIDAAEVEPFALACKIDEVCGTDVGEYSDGGREWAESMSWSALKPRYLEVLANV